MAPLFGLGTPPNLCFPTPKVSTLGLLRVPAAASSGSGVPTPSGHRSFLISTLLVPTEIQENAISPEDVSRMQAEVLGARHVELQDRLRGISQGFDRLRKVSHQGYGGDAGERGRGPWGRQVVSVSPL